MLQGATTLVLDLAKAFERVSLPVVLVWATHISFFLGRFLRVLCVYFEHQFEHCVAKPLQTIAAPSQCSSRRFVSEVMKVYPTLKLKVFEDDLTAFVKGWNE